MCSTKIIKKDYIVAVGLAIFIWIIAASSLGFFNAGFDCMLVYDGGDSLSVTAQVKELLQENWVWNTNRMGAPYGHEALAYPSVCLHIPELLMMKFWGLFTDNVALVINLQYLFTFSLCAAIAYFTLRKMGVGSLLAFLGGTIFSLNPYIYSRGISHFSLSACYFIPLSIYLCYYCYFYNDEVCQKNILIRKWINIIFMCLCIAINGIGYYPFFTCFLLGVTAVCIFFKTNSIKQRLLPVGMILTICVFMFIALIPSYIYKINAGIDNITSREVVELELYSLKISQLFMPIYTHGLSFVANFRDEYNGNMPLVNENVSSYLGVVACVGFIIGILYLLGLGKNTERDEDILFFSKLNMAAVITMSVGGFISLINLSLHIYGLRGFNRISVYISFCCISIICILLQRYVFHSTDGRIVFYEVKIISIILLIIFGIWEQTPQLTNSGEDLLENKKTWDDDEKFIKGIESQLSKGDMVYQMPYHIYPEGGTVNDMADYQLLKGFVHSDTLRWSYGAFSGTEGDEWNKKVSQLPIEERISAISSSGFKGIYIDGEAYTAQELEDLLLELERVLGESPIVSNDGKLFFFNLNN